MAIEMGWDSFIARKIWLIQENPLIALICLGVIIWYIWMRLTGRMENSMFERLFNRGKGGGGNKGIGGGFKNKPDYIIK